MKCGAFLRADGTIGEERFEAKRENSGERPRDRNIDRNIRQAERRGVLGGNYRNLIIN